VGTAILDRLRHAPTTKNVVWAVRSLRRDVLSPQLGSFPILIYHRIVAASGEPGIWGDLDLSTFVWQMDWLAHRGYRGVSLGEAWDTRDPETGQERTATVALTFDDAYLETLTLVAPVLQKHGFAATVFACTDLVGRHPQWLEGTHSTNRLRLLDWAELQQLAGLGFEIGSHTRTHALLTSRASDKQAMWHEIAGSSSDLRSHLGVSARFLAYPWGAHDASVREMTERAGYTGAVAVFRGTPLSQFALPRHDFTEQGAPGSRLVRLLGARIGFALAFRGARQRRRLVEDAAPSCTPNCPS
jgi:peptidoglycan/xylan/chitin deacetylase (PgdA/CDA1 family)